ncbi:MAG TPA: ATP-binding protein [Caulobacteraceae bacterium]|jgi:signal transduction histidine kinase|nr:ATP-binding protein [Caulobacteraceae bacterium]
MTLPGVAFINGRLSMGARMLALSLVFFVPIALLTGLFIRQSWKDISFAQKEIAGEAYEASVWPVLQGGATPTAAAAFDAARVKYDPAFGTGAASGAFAASRDAAGRLAAGKALTTAISDGSNLTLDPDLQSFYLMVPVAFRLPPMLQATSDLEAATALPSSDPARSVRIAEAVQMLNGSAAATGKDFETSFQADASGRLRRAMGDDAAELDRLATAVIAHRDALIAGAPGDSVSPDIEALRTQLDAAWQAANQQLQRLLVARVRRLTGELVLNLALVLAFSGLAGSLAVTIAGGIAGRTAALQVTVGRLMAGETQLEVPHLADQNESGRIAQAIDAFRLGLLERARLQEEAAAQATAAAEARAVAEAERARVVRFLSVGELAAAIAHEINQPIAAVVAGSAAATRWLEGDAPNIDRARTAIGRIVRDANRASDVVRRIRQILSENAPALSAVDINDAAEEALQFTERERSHAGVMAEVSLAPGLPPVRGDRVQLQQVILNLILNAIDAMRQAPPGQPCVLKLITSITDEGEVLVCVQDFGVGLAVGQAERLFDPFFTTKRDGMGLGLSISRSIIEQHGGRIWVEAGDDCGAVFRFTLQPWTEEDARAATAAKGRRRSSRLASAPAA